jgi:hypothetical protein
MGSDVYMVIGIGIAGWVSCTKLGKVIGRRIGKWRLTEMECTGMGIYGLGA